MKKENIGRKKQGKREYLNNWQTRDLMKKMNLCFYQVVNVPRMTVGKKQSVETLIIEEALLFAKYLRREINKWKPRIVVNPRRC